jgi:phosphatidylserine/phosphatidylglycerophosphate/cardiolipin synthase-like enzyme
MEDPQALVVHGSRPHVTPVTLSGAGLGLRRKPKAESIQIVPARPTVEFFTGEAMGPVIMSEFRNIRHSLDGMQYCLDHTEILNQLVTKIHTEHIRARILVDRSQFLSKSSCARQPARMRELFEAGCELRTMKPEGGGWFASMHVKTWIVDKQVVITGSTNTTHNGLENNKEQMFKIREPSVVDQVVADFEQTWDEGIPVSQQVLEEMLANTEKPKGKSRNSRSQSQGRDVSRSLSVELEESHGRRSP